MESSTLIAAFERVAAQHPNRIAIDALDRSIGYGALDRYANAVAAAVREATGPEPEPIPLLMEQQVPFMAAMLGAMKARNSFSPLDPVYPPERLAQVLGDLDARVLLTDSAHSARAAGAVALLDEPRPLVINVEPLEDDAATPLPCAGPAPGDLAWVTWTSGSTGRPKGVTQNHGNAHAMTRSYIDLASITIEDRLTLLHPALTWDIFGALLSGATLCPYDVRVHGVGGAGAWLRARRVTLFRSFPTTYRQIMATLDGRTLPDVRLVHLSGETIMRSDVDLFRKACPPGSKLLVLFGSSEAGIVATEVIGHDEEIGAVVSIGSVLPDVELQLVGEGGAPVAEGEVGEMCVRSRHVFPGYWRRPDLTAAAFLPSSDCSAAPYFRSGDMGRVGAGGKLFYAGRRDAQVKIRGYRIELGEIETALQGHPAVRQAAARTFDGPEGDKRLVAYYVASKPETSAVDLRSYLEQRLPASMIPDRFVLLDALPMTSNGKTDRRALPLPSRFRPEIETAYLAPAGARECELAAMFGGALELDEIGANDSFFALGGKSLAAVRLLAEIASAYGVRISPNDFFDAPTVAATARRLAEPNSGAAADEGLASLLDEIEGLSDEDARTLLEKEVK